MGDCFAIGPIAGDWDARVAWLDGISPAPLDVGADWMKRSAEQFLADIRSGGPNRLVWIAPQSACEQCGLQWYFEQFPDAPAGPMIIADQPIVRGWFNSAPLGLGELSEAEIAGLLDGPRRQWPSERASPEPWRRLRAENVLLRVVEGGELRSAEPHYFDDLLFDQLSTDWNKWARVVGGAMVAAGERGHNISDSYLLWRVRELVDARRIECQGEMPGPQHDRDNRPNAKLRLRV